MLYKLGFIDLLTLQPRALNNWCWHRKGYHDNYEGHDLTFFLIFTEMASECVRVITRCRPFNTRETQLNSKVSRISHQPKLYTLPIFWNPVDSFVRLLEFDLNSYYRIIIRTLGRTLALWHSLDCINELYPITHWSTLKRYRPINFGVGSMSFWDPPYV